MATIDCPKCGNEIYNSVLDETAGNCPHCEKFIRPPKIVLAEWKAIQLSGVTNMLEWDTVMDVAERHGFIDLMQFLTDESRMPTESVESLSRGLEDYDVEPDIDPEDIEKAHEEAMSGPNDGRYRQKA